MSSAGWPWRASLVSRASRSLSRHVQSRHAARHRPDHPGTGLAPRTRRLRGLPDPRVARPASDIDDPRRHRRRTAPRSDRRMVRAGHTSHRRAACPRGPRDRRHRHRRVLARLHFDHCGQASAFQAPVYVQAAPSSKPPRTPATTGRESAAIPTARLRIVEGDTEIVDGVRLLLTPGHTPGHRSVVVEDNGEGSSSADNALSTARRSDRVSQRSRTSTAKPGENQRERRSRANRCLRTVEGRTQPRRAGFEVMVCFTGSMGTACHRTSPRCC